MKTLFTAKIPTLVFVAASATLFAADFPDWKDFDADKSGKLDPGKDGELGEADIYALHVLASDDRWRKWDTNRNGIIESEEVSELIRKANTESAEIVKANRKLASNNAAVFGVDVTKPATGEQLDEVLRVSPPRAKYVPDWFRLRGKIADFAKPVPGGNIEQLNPAVFSWSHDFDQGSDTWTARGAVGGIWEIPPGDLLVGAEFDKMDSSASGAKETDTLNFRVMGSFEPALHGKWGPLKALGIRGGVDYGTTFEFDRGVAGVGIEIEPVWSLKAFRGIQSLLGKGNGRSALNSPSIALNNYIRIEAGGLVDDPPGVIGAADSYLRVGPNFDLAFWPFGTKWPISLTASYGYYADLLGEGRDDYHNLRTGLDIRLDQEGHYSLRLEYIKGVTALVLQPQDNLLLTLSVRF